MRIDVAYDDRPPRIIETSGEAMLSSSTVANAPEWRGAGLPVTAVMLRPRTDLLSRPDSGLSIELCAWSAAGDGRGGAASISDFGHVMEAHRLQFHVFRTWEVLPPEDVAHVVDIAIDGRVHVCRLGGRLLDLTCYERQEERLLSRSEMGAHPLDQRVLLVHERLRRERPGMTDAEAAASYGLGSELLDYALSFGGSAEEGDGGSMEPDGGLGELAAMLAAAASREDRVLLLEDAMLADPDLTLDALRRSLGRGASGSMDVDGLWEEAVGRIEGEDPWSDDGWEEFGQG